MLRILAPWLPSGLTQASPPHRPPGCPVRPEALGQGLWAPGPVSSIPGSLGPWSRPQWSWDPAQEPCPYRPAAWGGGDLLGWRLPSFLQDDLQDLQSLGPQLLCVHQRGGRTSASRREMLLAATASECHALPPGLERAERRSSLHSWLFVPPSPGQAGLTEEGDGHRRPSAL